MTEEINAGPTSSISISVQIPAKSDCSNKWDISEVISIDFDEYISSKKIKNGSAKGYYCFGRSELDKLRK